MEKKVLVILLCWIAMFLTVNCKKQSSCKNCNINRAPVANAGRDKSISLPVTTVILDGSASSDPDNNIASYVWSKISGPASFSFSNADLMQTQVLHLVQGEYLFELRVTDTEGLIGRDTVKVTVNDDPISNLVDIYVAGVNNNEPVYWKNGQVNYLNGGEVGYSGTSIAVSGSNICVTATRSELMWFHTEAKYWKNGVSTKLGTYAGASAVAISGNDVYVAGYEYDSIGWRAKYWKNGQEVPLASESEQSSASSIVVVGNDVYVAGTDGDVAKYWKNGQAVSLTNGSKQAYANAIAVIGTDVYVAGEESNGTVHVAKYWKNGREVVLSNGTRWAFATAITVSGDDVFVAGWEGDFYGMAGGQGSVAKYWKNGVAVNLTNGNTYAYAQSIAVYESDVYVAGVEFVGSASSAKYWKNGHPVSLSNSGNSSANCIAVVKK